MEDVNGGRVPGRPRVGWVDGVKVAMGCRGVVVKAARQCAKDKNEWSATVHMSMIEFNAAIFALLCILSDRPLALWWLITRREVGCRYMMRLR